MSKIIKLNSKKYPGYECIVDDEDYEILNQYKWHPLVSPKNHNNIYAMRRIDKKHFLMHRFILKFHEYDIENKILDHKDQNGLNNQIYG